MNIDINRAKLTTISQEINETLKQGQQMIFLGRGSVTEARFKDNNDGTVNATYIVKPELIDFKVSGEQKSIVDDNKVRAKSRSQALRHKAFVIAQELEKSDKAIYNSAMDEAESYLDNLLDEAYARTE
jgi:hypothetical protein